MDINVEIGKCDTVQEALRRFSAAERLDGKNKYQCDK
jgi:ubiquitin C-terminal hydrolase